MNKLANILILTIALFVGGVLSSYAQTPGPRIKGSVYGGGENAKVHTDTEVILNNGEVYGDIYGGGALADVEGSTSVNIAEVNETQKGKFAGNVFGGGKGEEDGSVSANVKGNTSVSVTGGEIIWKKAWDATGRAWKEWDSDNAFFFNERFLQRHNIYAGGNYACTVGTWNDEGTSLEDGYANTGTSSLTMTRGLFDKDLLSSTEWKQAFNQHEDPHFYAFGGGYGIFTKAHKSDVQILLPMHEDASASGGDTQLARPRKASGDNQTLPMPVINDNYGVAWTTVLGVVGGGYNGHVETTDVLVGDATYAHRVYGGGLGSYEGWAQASAKAKALGTTPNTNDAGYVGTTGKLPLSDDPDADLQTTHVAIAGGHIFGEVFGGGAGVASRKLDGSNYTDFPEIARVKGNTLVETCSYRAYKYALFLDSLANYSTNHDYYTGLDTEKNLRVPDDYLKSTNFATWRGQVFGNVYGGGDVANVSGNTKVAYHGGQVFGQTFGAGLGRLTTEANNYKTIGCVEGNAEVEISDTIFVPKLELVNIPDRLQDNPNVTNIVGNQKQLSDTPGDYTCFFVVQDNSARGGINFKPHAWNDIYGGGRNGLTEGDASVHIGGGYVGNNIFGGGLGNVDVAPDDNTIQHVTSADVLGNTNVTVTGGQYLWRKIADVNGNIKTFNDVAEEFDRNVIYDRAMHDQLFEPVKDFFDYRTASYTRDHSIYGGGNIACKVGTYGSDDTKDANGNITDISAPDKGTGVATVDMLHGLFPDTDIKWTDDETWNLATLCRYLACENSSNYQFGVFGGGYGANTKVGSTEVKLEMGRKEVQAEQASGDPTHYPSIWNTYMGKIKAEYLALDTQTQNDYYGGGLGENALNRYLTARMARSINVPSHTVLTTAGGGLAGYVAGDTHVHQFERSGSLRVFGGGIGQRPTDTELAKLDSDGAAAMTYGQVGGNTTVDIEYGVVVKDVFGGGAGIESIEYSSGKYVDFTNMARVKGKTDVTVHTKEANNPSQTLVYGQVFGGGDVANVGDPAYEPSDETAGVLLRRVPRTKVTVRAGCVFGEIFAGGSGRTATYCDDYKNLGAVYGDTQLVIDETGTNSTWLWKDAYGGGRNGLVYGNTLVDVKGGWVGSDIYGGGLGNLDTKYNPETGRDENFITKANVTQNTNILVRGGQYCLSQSWNEVTRNWHPMNKYGGNSYSSQYDPIHNKFLIGHNIYGGGNVACDVAHNAWVDINKGLLPKVNRLGHKEPTNLFEEDEWENIYNKHASPYFSVFGGGYGENTSVDNTHVTVNMGTDDGLIEPSDGDITAKEKSEIFADRQTLMDVIGGGFQGGVTNTCYVDIDGYTFMRNAFGGAYYATVGNTDVKVTRANMDNVYGGGMMGDVKTNVNVRIGTEVNIDDDDDTNNDAYAVKERNRNLLINYDVYGANDVAGYVGAKSLENGEIEITPESEGVKLKLNGGHIYGSVYGGGNGNYLYKIDEDVAKVTVEEDYQVTAEEKHTIYKVPLRASDFPSLSAMSSQQKIVNVISYRPSTMKVDIDFKGNSSTDLLCVEGNIFGGGNSATINDYDGVGVGNDAQVTMNVGSHIRLGGVFLGSDGEALFVKEQQSSLMEYFPLINDLTLYEEIDWTSPENQEIPVKFLPTPKEKRPEIYKNNIDLYFLPVEMAIMPEVTWGKARQNNSINLAAGTLAYSPVTDDENGLTDAEIGTFCCGGNRGNMDTGTNFHINFPEGLTITDKIVGGCNNANYTYNKPGTYDDATEKWETLDHTGGFLLGTHGVGTGRTPQIHLTMRNKFRITETEQIDGVEYYKERGNVFGGCYKEGVVRGDILLEMFSNMLMSGEGGNGLDPAMLRRTADNGLTVASVYGAGYGPGTWVRGDTEVILGDETKSSTFSDSNGSEFEVEEGGSSCNYIFGGGRQGNVIGNTNVHIKNGRVAGCVVGASYAGELYGNAQTMVGFPELYYRAKVSRSYDVMRADEDDSHANYEDDKGKKLIQKKVYYTNGDLVTATIYNSIKDKIVDTKVKGGTAKATAITEAEEELAGYFEAVHSIPTGNDWTKVSIQIDQAIYGGGYALATGSGSYTVKKYSDEHKFLDSDITGTYKFDNKSGWENAPANFTYYGGNTFVIVGDVSGNYDQIAETSGSADKTKDHITLSSSQLRPMSLNVGDDLYGLFKHLTNKEADPTRFSEEEWEKPENQAWGEQTSGQYMQITTEEPYKKEDKTSGRVYYEYAGEGGIYGDGRLSISEGFRVCDVVGYGYNSATPKSPKLMNCIHRFDVARFKDCCISLLGDRDYTTAEGSEANAMRYSIARVAEIQMESSIEQDKDFLDTDKQYSRNYVGLSSAQFDLSAIKSNDAFTADADAALYHNKQGQVISTSMDIEGTEENGTAKKFPGAWSYYNVKKWYLNEYNADDANNSSEYYDDENAQVRNERQFQLRNSATARNMFGIFSGYALNVHSQHYVNSKPEPYYGPVIGVFEVDLIGTREGEAGGYAYAQNIHTENAKGSDGKDIMQDDGDGKGKHTVHSFLESSGNFVFPATDVRKVVDNCTPTAYTKSGRDHAEAHYWYVTGFKYYYNATITGYTYDGKTKYFYADNTAKRLVLTGTKKDQEVSLEHFHWLPRHAQGRQEVCDIEKKYLTRKDGESYADLAKSKKNWKDIIKQDDRKENPFYNLGISLTEFGNYVDDGPFPHISLLPQDEYSWSSNNAEDPDRYKIYSPQEEEKFKNAVQKNDPMIAIRLADCVNNNGKEADDGESYFSHYLDDDCVARIVLTAPALNNSGEPIFSNYIEASQDRVNNDNRTVEEYNKNPYYELDAEGSYKKITLDEALGNVNGTKKINVFRVPLKDEYELVGEKAFDSKMKYYTYNEGVYTEVNDVDASNYDSKKSTLYYLNVPAAHPENYVYDITLTIKYIKGPSYVGHIDIKNCALPGEMIRLSHENLKVESDVFSLPHKDSFWTIGPGKKVWNDDSDHSKGYHWELIDEMGTKERKSVDGSGVPITYYYNDPDTRNLYYPYNPYVTDPKDKFKDRPVSTIMRQGLYHNASDEKQPDYFVPAYYFMNGYVAQYSFTVSGIDEVFTTVINPEDTLLVHNYHRMAKASATVDGDDDIKLSRAMKEYANVPGIGAPELTDDDKTQMTAEWQAVHKRPRVYIQNVDDLKAFAQYLRRTTNNETQVDIREAVAGDYDIPDYEAVVGTYVKRDATDYGSDVEFFLMNDLDLTGQSWTAVDFKGTFHGNGHVIKGLPANGSLFATNSGDIHNLGMTVGKIAETNNGTYHCCYTYADNTVYRKDGSLYTAYTEDDWRSGRVAYDLNEYYLAERLDRGSDDADTHDHTGYVENLYADGEYRFSRWAGSEAASEYLRSATDPNYAWGYKEDIVSDPSSVSNHHYHYDAVNHILSHKKDEPRAYYENEVDPAVSVLKEYRPLIDEAKVNTAADPAPTAKKNDYIFFGQTVNKESYTNALGTVGSNLPDVIDASSRTTTVGSYEGVTHNVSDQNNRLWRAYGFYQSKVDDAFHFNRAAVAVHPKLTAIDFAGQHESAHTWTAGYDPSTASATSVPIFYPQVMDMPEGGLTSFSVDSNRDYNADGSPRSASDAYDNAAYGHVTQNLLVYNNGETAFDKRDTKNIAEKDVLYHNLVFSGSPAVPTTDYFHLVDKQDFNAPIAFKVNTRAWYERLPQSYRNVSSVGYENGSAWEGIVLPFTATKVTAEKNGEISHFYGNDNLHHEYWLRGLTDVKTVGDKTIATFARPGVSGTDVFVNDPQTAAKREYSYPANTYFTSLYDYNKHNNSRDDDEDGADKINNPNNEWYSISHSFANYVPLTAEVPYIVAFPGDDFYEFSMESYYKTSAYGKETYKQKATFETGATTVLVSDDNAVMTTAGSVVHNGSYLHKSAVMGINAGGSAFEEIAEDKYVLPFRTYLTDAPTASARARRVMIYDSNVDGMEGILQDEEEPENPGEELSGKSLKMYVMGTELIIESNFVTDLRTYTAAGQYIRLLHVNEGVNRYNDLGRGIYIIGNKKVIIR